MNEYMDIAIKEAKKAFSWNEIPVGAVIVKDNKIIAKSYNHQKKTGNSLHHAEILAIEKAIKKIGDWRLNDCEMYVTLEPCPMCAGAIVQSRIKKVYIGTPSNLKSNQEIIKKILQNAEFYHHTEIEYVESIASANLLSVFFANKR